MPFTLTHAVAAIPIHALFPRRLPLSALIVGTMAPDLPYFVPGNAHPHAAHSTSGLLMIALPAGLAAFLVFDRFLKRALTELLPEPIRRRACAHALPIPLRTLRQVACVIIAILAGAATHVAWDAFTHRDHAGVELVPILRESWVVAGGMSVAGYDVLQYASSIIGLPLLGWWTVLRVRRMAPATDASPAAFTPRTRRLIACGLLGIAIVVGVVAAALRGEHQSSLPLAYVFFGRFIRHSGTALLAGVAAYAAWFNLRARSLLKGGAVD